MLRNLYCWLAAGQSALASAPLLAAVRSAMRKVVLQLVAEAGKLGATVVAADFSSVIIATGKQDLASAVGCVNLQESMPHSKVVSASAADCYDFAVVDLCTQKHVQVAWTFHQTPLLLHAL